jgi:hypothetical protein
MRARLLASASLFSLAAVATALTLGGCGSSTQKPRGTLGAACYADNLCNAELTCLAGVCVPADGGSLPVDAAGADAHPDAVADGATDAQATPDAGTNDGGDAAPASDATDATDATTSDATAGDASDATAGDAQQPSSDAQPASDATASDGSSADTSPASDGGADAQDGASSDTGAGG